MNPGKFTRRSSLSAEWRIFAILMLAAAALLGYLITLGQPVRFIYDALLRTTERPQTNEIIIVAIDERSIGALGRWPWPRDTHAHLLDILTAGGARAVGLDILLSEPGRDAMGLENDVTLAAALARNGRTVLPVAFERSTTKFTTTLPLPLFADAAAGLGHTHFRFDEDGILRSTYLREGPPLAMQPQFALAMYDIANAPAVVDRRTPGTASPTIKNNVWRRDDLMNIPFAGTPGHFRILSYVDVLTGQITPTFFSGKYVLVGATAAGLAAMVPTPLTTGYQGMSGVEVNANILAALLHNTAVETASRWQAALFGMLSTLLSLLACRYLSPLRALLCTLVLVAGILCVTYAAFRMNVWLPPGSALVMVLLVYPLWSWRRLEAALAFLNEEFSCLNRSTTIVLGDGRPLPPKEETDFLDRRIAEMRLAASRARDMQRFIADSLDSMPDATLVLSPVGNVLMYNRVAKTRLKATDADHMSLDSMFSRIQPSQLEHGQPMHWPQLLLTEEAGRTAVEVEARDADGREFLVKSAACRGIDGKTLGWIVSLIDVTSLRTAERHRDETLRFISHDMRAPQSSILALLELQKNPQTAFSADDFYARVEKSVQATLSLADDFVHLAKAKSAAYHLQEADFPSMLADAVDNMWAYARSRDIKVVVNAQFTDAWVSVDRPLMVRALGNLLSNAIKFSQPGSEVKCSVRTVQKSNGNYIRCNVRDNGKGISESLQKQIFSPFPRREKSGREGVGLGLAFVKMVVERHGGTIDFVSRPGKGSIFMMLIPCVTDSLVVATVDQTVSEKKNTGVDQ